MWRRWSADNVIPFRAADIPGIDSRKVGNGEHKLAHELGGVVSDVDGYDVLASGTRVEVKQLGRFRSSIEPGVASRFRERVCTVAHTLRDAFVSETTERLEREGLLHLRERAVEISRAVEKGIGVGVVLGRTFKKSPPIVGLKQVVAELREKRSADMKIDCLIGESVVSLPTSTFLKVCRLTNVTPHFEPRAADVILSMVDDDFLYPDVFDRLWCSVVPSAVLYEKADELVLVHADLGYYRISRPEEADAIFKFVGTYKGDAQFTVDPGIKKEIDFIVECRGELGRNVHSAERIGHDDQVAQAGSKGDDAGDAVEVGGDRLPVVLHVGSK